jgi:hypothetical protein
MKGKWAFMASTHGRLQPQNQSSNGPIAGIGALRQVK